MTLATVEEKITSMGVSPSKKIEEILETSTNFQAAVDESFEECMILSQHMFPGLQAYQLLDAVQKVYEKLSVDGDDVDDVLFEYKEKWLPQAPTQLDVDRTIQKERILEEIRGVVTLNDFRTFARTLFRDMVLTTCCHRLAVFVPASGIGVLCADFLVKKLPVVGPVYRAGGPLLPGLLLGAIVGVVLSQFKCP